MNIQAGKMVQQGKALATKPMHLDGIPRTYMVGRELIPINCPLTSTCMLWCVCVTLINSLGNLKVKTEMLS